MYSNVKLTVISIVTNYFIDIKPVFSRHSTVFQLIETFHSIAKNIDEDNHYCTAFYDLSKAFDKV